MKFGAINLWEDCKDCDSIDSVKEHLEKFIVNQSNMFYHKPHYSSKEACKYLKISKKTLGISTSFTHFK